MIRSFKDKATEKIYNYEFCKHIPQSIRDAALRQLMRIDSANKLSDLLNPPSNHLEELSGKYKGKWSVRINNQWRIVFKPIDGGRDYEEVEIVDYH